MRRALVHQAWPVLTALPVITVDGQEIYFQADAGPPAVVWHLRRRASKWEYVGGPPIVYRQEGENAAYVNFASGTNITVNAAATKVLQWNFVPPLDCWADIDFNVSLVQKVDAAYASAQFNVMTAGPVALGTPQSVYRTQHSQVNQYEPYYIHQRFGLTGGQGYSFWLQTGISGGTWTFNQGAMWLSMAASAWPR